MSKRVKQPKLSEREQIISDIAIAGYAIKKLGMLITSKRKQMPEVHACRAGMVAVFKLAQAAGGDEMMDVVSRLIKSMEVHK